MASPTSAPEDALPLSKDATRLGRMVVGLVFLLLAIGYLMVAFDMPTGSLSRPGPGMFPIWVGVITAISAFAVVVEAMAGKSESGPLELPEGTARRSAIIFMATLVGFILVLPWFGQYISSVVYVIVFLRLVGQLSWIRSVLIGTAIGAGLTYAFTELLGLPLPEGTLLPF